MTHAQHTTSYPYSNNQSYTQEPLVETEKKLPPPPPIGKKMPQVSSNFNE
jgi:hypothetical protein